ncbi:transcriptional regulator, partial [Striga asiatica]
YQEFFGSRTFTQDGTFDPLDRAFDEAIHSRHRTQRKLGRRNRVDQNRAHRVSGPVRKYSKARRQKGHVIRVSTTQDNIHSHDINWSINDIRTGRVRAALLQYQHIALTRQRDGVPRITSVGNVCHFLNKAACSSLRKSNTLLGGTGSQNEVAALSTIPGGLPGSHHPNIVRTTPGKCRPRVSCRCPNARAEAHHHPLRQLQHALPTLRGRYNCTISTLASRSHCRSRVETHRRAPKARPELTSALYMVCTARSSISTCSTHVTWPIDNIYMKLLNETTGRPTATSGYRVGSEIL